MATGASIWETTLGDRIESSAALSLCGNYIIVGESLTLCILETPEGVFWQTVKTKMKYRNTRHFTRACTVCYDKYNHQGLK